MHAKDASPVESIALGKLLLSTRPVAACQFYSRTSWRVLCCLPIGLTGLGSKSPIDAARAAFTSRHRSQDVPSAVKGIPAAVSLWRWARTVAMTVRSMPLLDDTAGSPTPSGTGLARIRETCRSSADGRAMDLRCILAGKDLSPLLLRSVIRPNESSMVYDSGCCSWHRLRGLGLSRESSRPLFK